ncbi:MAG: (2Fe-2S) ferredoxin domain-containing protein [Acidaminococcus sp.]|nr:(2Fe-2S) ferredoxin domain-containing protein [Acidaminococcus sp.]MDD7398077.1 (2Fe-2S) ferredoxin domain-containing protein [Bacillota bacterium]MDY4558889.1 (2Fe-2S) ferredoxin domain-containing protein [Eubacteriales bacterium]MDY5345559.1 (2Fe-2S) ferredoxin domain-containing protein [Eubacteriales bacterium]
MKSIADIKAIRDKMQAQIILRDNNTNEETRIVVGMATCGISAGARPVFNTLVEEVATRQLKNVKVSRSGCLGMCKLEPIVEVFVPGQEKVTYVKVDPEKAKQIIASHIVNGNICTDYLITNE